jgi:hypothetical protein
MNKSFERPDAKEIIRTSTSIYEKLSLLNALSQNLFCAYFLSQHFRIQEVNVSAILRGNRPKIIELKEEPAIEKGKMYSRGKMTATVGAGSRVKVVYAG